ncbi:hypothetical protein V8E53_015851 [Lactarius tabidus]
MTIHPFACSSPLLPILRGQYASSMTAYWPTPPGPSKDEELANRQDAPIPHPVAHVYVRGTETRTYLLHRHHRLTPPYSPLWRDPATTLSDTNGGINIDPLGRGTSCFQQELEAAVSGITKPA